MQCSSSHSFEVETSAARCCHLREHRTSSNLPPGIPCGSQDHSVGDRALLGLIAAAVALPLRLALLRILRVAYSASLGAPVLWARRRWWQLWLRPLAAALCLPEEGAGNTGTREFLKAPRPSGPGGAAATPRASQATPLPPTSASAEANALLARSASSRRVVRQSTLHPAAAAAPTASPPPSPLAAGAQSLEEGSRRALFSRLGERLVGFMMGGVGVANGRGGDTASGTLQHVLPLLPSHAAESSADGAEGGGAEALAGSKSASTPAGSRSATARPPRPSDVSHDNTRGWLRAISVGGGAQGSLIPRKQRSSAGGHPSPSRLWRFAPLPPPEAADDGDDDDGRSGSSSSPPKGGRPWYLSGVAAPAGGRATPRSSNAGRAPSSPRDFRRRTTSSAVYFARGSLETMEEGHERPPAPPTRSKSARGHFASPGLTDVSPRWLTSTGVQSGRRRSSVPSAGSAVARDGGQQRQRAVEEEAADGESSPLGIHALGRRLSKPARSSLGGAKAPEAPPVPAPRPARTTSSKVAALQGLQPVAGAKSAGRRVSIQPDTDPCPELLQWAGETEQDARKASYTSLSAALSATLPVQEPVLRANSGAARQSAAGDAAVAQRRSSAQLERAASAVRPSDGGDAAAARRRSLGGPTRANSSALAPPPWVSRKRSSAA